VAVRTGFDTGFFVLLAGQDPEAIALWEEVSNGGREVLVSALSLCELHRLGLRGAVPLEFAEGALELVPQVCRVVWIDEMEALRSAAQLSHGLDLTLTDALILATLVAHDCREIFTTDRDLAGYLRQGLELRLLGGSPPS
jgi:predicted nucleic acid-binding protein